MKLATIEKEHSVRVVAVVGDAPNYQYVDLRAIDPDIPISMAALLWRDGGLDQAARALEQATDDGPFIDGVLRTPIREPGKIFCIGLNYRDHAVESGLPIPEKPVCFSKFSQTVIATGDNIRLPRASTQVDYEAELVVVIGRRAKNIAEEDAMSVVAGYMNGNDVSARDWQINAPGGQWLMGKTADTFAPIGPFIVTKDEIPDPGNLAIELRLNGETMQQSRTSELIFTIPQLITHLSQMITLTPGDIIFTGTPPGVGMARKPPVFLKPGDRVDVEIEGLGTLRNQVVNE